MLDQASTLRKIMTDIRSNEPSFFNAPSTNATPEVIVVTGGKGGIGKSLSSANIGLSMAQSGGQVLLVDADLGLANLDVLMGVHARATIEHVLNGEAELRHVVCTVAEGLDLIPASSGALRVPTLDRLKKLSILDQIDKLDRCYDTIIIDTAAGLSDSVQNWASLATQCLLVCTPEPTSLADAYATMKILHARSGTSSFRLVVNMVNNEGEALRVYDKLASLGEEFLGVRVTYLGYLPFDESVRRSVRERVPLLKRYPFSPAAAGFRGIAKELQVHRSAHSGSGTCGFLWSKLASHSEVQARY